ncbi:hypothetical protein [Streptomyces sp. CAI-21]|uniref:hypothetical protein n=1 Tax=Streptomyces sp. CAI-21 TaxID=1169743 RepID=UPI0020CA3F83
MTASTATALTHVRVFDGERLREPGTVVIDGPLIGTDPAGARVVDCRGATLLPGLIDAHVHVRDAGTLDRLAHHGVTTALDMGGWPRPSSTRCAACRAPPPCCAPGPRPPRPAASSRACRTSLGAACSPGPGTRRPSSPSGRSRAWTTSRSSRRCRARPGRSPRRRWRPWSAPPANGGCARCLRAYLVLVDGDPLADITATARVRAVWCGGVERPGL